MYRLLGGMMFPGMMQVMEVGGREARKLGN